MGRRGPIGPRPCPAQVVPHGTRSFSPLRASKRSRLATTSLATSVRATVVAEGVGPQPDEGLADADLELGGDHARSLVHDVVEIGTQPQLERQLAGGRVRLQDQHCLGGDVGHDQGIGVLVVGQWPRPVAVQVERPETYGPYLEREPEDRPHPRLDGRRAERQPPGRARERQVGFEHGPVLAVGVHARPLAQGVLQLLDDIAHLVGGAQRAVGGVRPHQHDPGAAHGGDIGAHLAQPLGPERAVPLADEQAEDPCSALTGPVHSRPPTGVRLRHAISAIRSAFTARALKTAPWPTGSGARPAAGMSACRPGCSAAGTATQEPSAFAANPSTSSGLGARRCSRRQMPMMRRTKVEGERTVNERDRWWRNSRAATITPRVEAHMSSTSLRSSTMGASLSAMAHAKVRHSEPSVEMSCSPRSQTTVGHVSGRVPDSGRRSGTVNNEDPAGPMALLLTQALRVSRYQGLEYRPRPVIFWPGTSGAFSCPHRLYLFSAAPARATGSHGATR